MTRKEHSALVARECAGFRATCAADAATLALLLDRLDSADLSAPDAVRLLAYVELNRRTLMGAVRDVLARLEAADAGDARGGS